MADLNDSEIILLIELYRSQKNLYNYQLKVYHDRQKAKESYLYIAAAMNKGWSESQTKARLKWLRNSYTRNRNLMQGSARSGASTDDQFQVKWKWYSLMDAFLRPYCKISTKSDDNLTPTRTPSTQSTENGREDCGSLEMYCSASEDEPGGKPVDSQKEAIDTNPSSYEEKEEKVFVLMDSSSQPWQPGPQRLQPQPAAPTAQPAHSSPPAWPPSPSSSANGAVTPPNFAGEERKRKASSQAGQQGAVAVLKDMAEVMKQNFKRRTEERRKREQVQERQSENMQYCMYVASQLDKMSRINQIKTRKMIDDILYEVSLREAEDAMK